MAENSPFTRIVMTANVRDILDAAQPWPTIRAITSEDIPWLANAAFESYPRRGLHRDWDATVAVTQEIFRGEWGPYMQVASPAALSEDGEILGGVTTVLRLAREDAPDHPYVLNCLTLPEHRGRGVASGLLAATARAVAAVGETHVGLTVDEDNADARRLYARLGFAEVSRGPSAA
jgi:ribosomal protein S18 acetylase RimI-like enzyme